MKRTEVRYDPEADALYVQLSEGAIAKTTSLGDLRLIDWDDDGGVVGVEFLGVSEGIDLHDLPFAQTIERAIGDSGHPIRILA
jgi:uncharacterized protein YuzE